MLGRHHDQGAESGTQERFIHSSNKSLLKTSRMEKLAVCGPDGPMQIVHMGSEKGV